MLEAEARSAGRGPRRLHILLLDADPASLPAS